jgi:hypothetical protein
MTYLTHSRSLLFALFAAALAAGCGGGSDVGSDSADLHGVPVIDSFTAAPDKVVPGGSTTLTWEVRGAVELSIDNGVGDVTGMEAAGATPVQTTTYTLTATGRHGARRSATATVTVAAPPTTGSLTIAIDGLPATYTVPDVSQQLPVWLGNSKQVLQGMATTQTIDNLAPDTYTVDMRHVESDGMYFAGTTDISPLHRWPDHDYADVAVAIGQTASVSVSYAPIDGKLQVSIDGLPAGSGANVVVTRPPIYNGFTGQNDEYRQVVFAGETLTHLLPSTYTLTASNVSGMDGCTYAPTSVDGPVDVAAGQAQAASVTYSATSGAIAINVVGLPASALYVADDAPVLQAIGPSGSLTFPTLTSGQTSTLGGVPPGTYSISAPASYSYQGVTYSSSVADASLSVDLGQVPQTTVTFTKN